MKPGLIKTANKLRQQRERLLLILLKLGRNTGGFSKLKEFGLTDDEILFLKAEFQDYKPA